MKKKYTYEEIYDMYKCADDETIFYAIIDMSKNEIEEIIADAQTHDLVGTYEMVMFLESILNYVDERDRED